MTNNTYTIAERKTGAHGVAFNPVKGIPTNMTLQQATKAKDMARVKGYDVVVFNTAAQ